MKLSWGIIGCGDVAERKGGPALYTAAHSQLVAVMRRDKAKAEDFAKRHGARRAYDRVEELLADPEINAVYVATPPYVHAEQTIMAAQAGKHVMCEKPMAMTVEEGQAMIAASRANGVQLMIAYYRRRFPSVLKIKQLVEAGTIGQVVKATVQIGTGFSPPDTPTKQWRLDPRIGGGGLLMDLGSHAIDLLHFFLGDVRDVAAFVDTVANDLEVENSSSLILRFRNEGQASVVVNQNVGVRCNVLTLGGTEGSLALVGGLGCSGVTLETAKGTQSFDLNRPPITHLGIVENLVASVEKGDRNCVDGEEGLKTTKVLAAAYESSARRSVVQID